MQPAPQWELSLSATWIIPGLDRVLLTDLPVLATREQLAATLISKNLACALLSSCLRRFNCGCSGCVRIEHTPSVAVPSYFSFIHYSHLLQSNERSVEPRACTSEQF